MVFLFENISQAGKASLSDRTGDIYGRCDYAV